MPAATVDTAEHPSRRASASRVENRVPYRVQLYTVQLYRYRVQLYRVPCRYICTGTAVLDLDLASTVDTAVQLYSSRRYYSRMIDLLISMQTYTPHIDIDLARSLPLYRGTAIPVP
jgi:hypothetical protein